MQTLLSRKLLSAADRQRLDLHFISIRDLENGIVCGPSGADSAHLQLATASLDDDDTIETVIKLHFDMLTLAVACGGTRAATLQIGCGPDPTRYVVDGVRQAPFHEISHRGDIPNADFLHHRIDRKLLGLFKYLLDKLAEPQTPNGTLLDQGIVVHVNDLANGAHSYDNVPYLLAGSAGGFLKTGLYIDAGALPTTGSSTRSAPLRAAPMQRAVHSTTSATPACQRGCWTRSSLATERGVSCRLMGDR